ncbi:hypothetical protein CEXT_767141 [Caerostris extrusa]|uniref:Uncharacterized protein n=1 Tax=Caerostris extrusa TaxID=172846 RepID=A0AAV4P5P4_CAEEX|nr:hypothetical protein CEXT_767141 [Caerostris extrusa]
MLWQKPYCVQCSEVPNDRLRSSSAIAAKYIRPCSHQMTRYKVFGAFIVHASRISIFDYVRRQNAIHNKAYSTSNHQKLFCGNFRGTESALFLPSCVSQQKRPPSSGVTLECTQMGPSTLRLKLAASAALSGVLCGHPISRLSCNLVTALHRLPSEAIQKYVVYKFYISIYLLYYQECCCLMTVSVISLKISLQNLVAATSLALGSTSDVPDPAPLPWWETRQKIWGWQTQKYEVTLQAREESKQMVLTYDFII